MRFLLASLTLLSLLAQPILSSSAVGFELVQLYYLYRMECMVYGPSKTTLLGDIPQLPPQGSWFKPPYDTMPIHPRPKGSAGDGMLTFFEFEQDLADPRRVANPGTYQYDVTSTAGGRMTKDPDGRIIGDKFKSWKYGATVAWRVMPEIYNEMLADYNHQKATLPKGQVNARYTGAQAAAKMEQLLQRVRKDFDALPNKGIGLGSQFDDLFGKFKANLADGLAWRRFDNRIAMMDWYVKEKKWDPKHLVTEKVTLPTGATFDDISPEKTIAGFNGDAAKLAKWQADTADMAGPAAKKSKDKGIKTVGSHLNVIQAWQRVNSAAVAPVPMCT